MGRSRPAAGTDTPNARKTRGGRRADVDSCRSPKPMQTTAPAEAMKAAAASKTRRDRRDVDACGPAKPMEAPAPAEAMKAAVGETGRDRRGAGVDIRRSACAAGA
jgi:hypothetical protein